MTTNFWGYILSGLSVFVDQFLAKLPAGQLNSVLSGGATMLFYAIGPVLVFVGPFINLQLGGSMLVIMIGLEVVRGIVAAYRALLKIIPAAN